jgi:hypothetical protein
MFAWLLEMKNYLDIAHSISSKCISKMPTSLSKAFVTGVCWDNVALVLIHKIKQNVIIIALG